MYGFEPHRDHYMNRSPILATYLFLYSLIDRSLTGKSEISQIQISKKRMYIVIAIDSQWQSYKYTIFYYINNKINQVYY